MMFIIMSYDVETKRVGKAHRIAKKYLSPVQRSLFQGFLTEKKVEMLKNELRKIIDCENDSVVIYKMLGFNTPVIDQIGVAKIADTNIL